MSNNLKDNLGTCSAYHNVKKLVIMHDLFHTGQGGRLVLCYLSGLSRQQPQCMLLCMVINISVSERTGTILAKNAKELRIILAVLTRAALDTGGPEVVLPVWVGYQLVQVGVVTHEARAGVLTHPIILEVPTGLQHKHNSHPAHRDQNRAPH